MKSIAKVFLQGIVGLVLAGTTFLTSAYGQDYPDRPVRVLIGTAPGGAVDIVGRIVMNKLGEAAGQAFIIENLPGPYNGLKKLQDSPADGYTVMLQSSTMTVTKALFPSLPFDPLNIAPVSQIADSALVMVVRKGLPKSADEIVKYAKDHPGTLTYGSAGYGSPPNIAGEMFKYATGTNILHIPFKGVGPALAEVAAGRVDIMFSSYASVMPFLQTNKVEELAVTTQVRAKQVPELPTLAELGYKDMVTSTWVGLIAPAATPAPVIAKLNGLIGKVMADPAVVTLLLNHGFEARVGTPAQFGQMIASDTAKNSQTVTQAGIKPE
jgi:tripartite-type tricarboxylate transporter receptor subunit TctC